MNIDNGLVISDFWAWGWEPPAALVSFSATLILQGEIADSRSWNFDLQDQISAGAVVERGMAEWWQDRLREGHYLAKHVSASPRASVADAGLILNDFVSLLPFGSGVYFGNASQDAALMRSAIQRAGLVPAWNISDQLCLNTLGRFNHV